MRKRAEDKTYSALGRIKQLKQRFPDKVVGVLGCMAQREQKAIFDRAPYVDLVVGPGQLHQVPDLIDKIEEGAGKQVQVSLGRTDGAVAKIKRSHESFDPLRDAQMRPTPWQAYVRIQIGCDKFCTYCIVPMVRGPEQGRPPEEIVEEARALAGQGCREITLLGQTVNSYQHVAGEKTTRLSDLLHQLHEIPGIIRLKFVTNYPKDMTDDLLTAVRELPKCSPYLYVPLQSGSDEMLKAMRRGYTTEDYRDMMARIKEQIPGFAVSSDFIVGFCGETEDDFQQTVAAVEEYRFKNSFIFKYSERPGTKAAGQMPDNVPDEVKRRRNNELLAVQNRISMEDNQQFVGTDVEVLVEGPSKAARNVDESQSQVQMTGRTHCDRIVVFEGNRRQAGHLIPVTIYDAHSHTLFGEVVTEHAGPELYSVTL